MEGSVSTQ